MARVEAGSGQGVSSFKNSEIFWLYLVDRGLSRIDLDG
jgi:hypothetical protein